MDTLLLLADKSIHYPMILILSPSKTMSFDSKLETSTTQPQFLTTTNNIMKTLKAWNTSDLCVHMKVSEKLAQESFKHIQDFKYNKPYKRSTAAIYAYDGDVYTGLDAKTLSDFGLENARKHLRILSGLYGLLRPFDLIQPYRLEIGLSYKFDEKSLYQIWKEKITSKLLMDLHQSKSKTLINLASNEYWKAIEFEKLKGINIINIEFLDGKDFKVISFNAKKARGMMARCILNEGIENPEDLKMVNIHNYKYLPKKSSENRLVFHNP